MLLRLIQKEDEGWIIFGTGPNSSTQRKRKKVFCLRDFRGFFVKNGRGQKMAFKKGTQESETSPIFLPLILLITVFQKAFLLIFMPIEFLHQFRKIKIIFSIRNLPKTLVTTLPTFRTTIDMPNITLNMDLDITNILRSHYCQGKWTQSQLPDEITYILISSSSLFSFSLFSLMRRFSYLLCTFVMVPCLKSPQMNFQIQERNIVWCYGFILFRSKRQSLIAQCVILSSMSCFNLAIALLYIGQFSSFAHSPNPKHAIITGSGQLLNSTIKIGLQLCGVFLNFSQTRLMMLSKGESLRSFVTFLFIALMAVTVLLTQLFKSDEPRLILWVCGELDDYSLLRYGLQSSDYGALQVWPSQLLYASI